MAFGKDKRLNFLNEDSFNVGFTSLSLKRLLPKLQYFLRFKIPVLILHILQMELSIPVHKEKFPYTQPRENANSMFNLPDLSS